MIVGILSAIVAKMGMMLLTQSVVQRVAVISIRALEAKVPNQSIKDALEIIAKEWEIK